MSARRSGRPNEVGATGGTAAAERTLSSIDLAAGQCSAGTVQVDLPADAQPGYVMLTDPLFDEIARWVAA